MEENGKLLETLKTLALTWYIGSNRNIKSISIRVTLDFVKWTLLVEFFFKVEKSVLV